MAPSLRAAIVIGSGRAAIGSERVIDSSYSSSQGLVEERDNEDVGFLTEDSVRTPVS